MSDKKFMSIPSPIANSLADFTGRVWVLHRINQWLATQQSRTFLITGEPGSGKSTLAARLVQISTGEVSAEGTPHLDQQWLTYAHFCQAQDNSTLNPLRFIESLSTHLAERYQPFAQALAQVKSDHSISINVTNTINTLESGSQVNLVVIKALNLGMVPARLAFDQVVRQPLEQLCTPDFQEPIVILVDSLDEALTFDQNENIVSLLSHVMTGLPVQVRLLLTSRSDPQVLNTIGPSILDLVQNLPQDIDDVGEYIARRVHALPEPRRHDVVQRVATAANGNFLYARYVLDDLLSRLDQIGNLQDLALPKDLEDIYRQFLHREFAENRQGWFKQYSPVLGTIALSRGSGLTRSQLAGITQFKERDIDSILEVCAQYLSNLGREGRFRIYHQSFRDFLLTDNEFPIYPAEANQDIAIYLLDEHEDWWADEERYGLQFLVTHLIEAAQQTEQHSTREQLIDKAIVLLTDFTFLEAKTALLGVDTLLDDLRASLNLPLDGRKSLFDFPTFIRLLDRKAYLLRGWNQKQCPAYFAQQMYIWAMNWPIFTLSGQAESRLAQLNQPYLMLRWRMGPESPLLIRTLTGHSDLVRSVALTSDNQSAVSASNDGTLIVWDLATGQSLYTLTGHSAMVRAVRLTSDDQYAISASNDGTLIVWDLVTRQPLRTLTGHSAMVGAVELTSDNKRAVSASADGTLMMWDLATGRMLQRLTNHSGSLYTVALTSDDQRAVAISIDKTMIVWDLATGELQHTFTGHSQRVRAVALTSDNQLAISASDDGALIVWDLATGQPLHRLTGHLRKVNAVAPTPDSQLAVSASDDGTLIVWDLATGQSLHTLTGHSDVVNLVVLTSDNKLAVSASRDNTLIIWNLDTRQPFQGPAGHLRKVNVVALTSDGQRAVSASDDGTLIVWDLATGQPLHRLTGHSAEVRAVALTSDGQRAVSVSRDNTLIGWDLLNGQPLGTLCDHKIWLSFQAEVNAVAVALTSDDQRAISVAREETLIVWDLLNGQVIHRLTGHSDWVSAVALTSDNQRAISAARDWTLIVWDLLNGQVIHRLTGHSDWVSAVALTSDNQRAISTSFDGTLIVWDLLNGQMLDSLKDYSPVPNRALWYMVSRENAVAVVLTSDDQQAFSVFYDGALKVWDLFSKQEVATLNLEARLSCIALMPDNATLLLGDAAGNLYCLCLVETKG